MTVEEDPRRTAGPLSTGHPLPPVDEEDPSRRTASEIDSRVTTTGSRVTSTAGLYSSQHTTGGDSYYNSTAVYSYNSSTVKWTGGSYNSTAIRTDILFRKVRS